MTEKEKQRKDRYRKSDKGKAKQRESYKRYRQTPKGKEARKRNR
jgi:DNA-binding transcriptional regulator PaaX